MGDVDIEQFIELHYEPVRRALALAIGDRDRAREVTQEAFAQAWRRWSRVSSMERPVAWVYVVAMNRARRDLGRERRRPVGFVEPSSADPLSSMADSLAVRGALDALPPRQRAAVVLRYLGDLTVAEIAEAMGCAEGTVKSTLHTALARLRVELEEVREP